MIANKVRKFPTEPIRTMPTVMAPVICEIFPCIVRYTATCSMKKKNLLIPWLAVTAHHVSLLLGIPQLSLFSLEVKQSTDGL